MGAATEETLDPWSPPSPHLGHHWGGQGPCKRGSCQPGEKDSWLMTQIWAREGPRTAWAQGSRLECAGPDRQPRSVCTEVLGPQLKGRMWSSPTSTAFPLGRRFQNTREHLRALHALSNGGRARGIGWDWGQAAVRVRPPTRPPPRVAGLGPSRGAGGPRAQGAGRRSERGRAAGARVRKRGAGSVWRPRSRGASGGGAGAGPEVRPGCEDVPPSLPLSRRPPGRRPGEREGRGRGSRRAGVCRGLWGERDREGLCPFALPLRPGLQQEPHPARAPAGRSRPEPSRCVADPWVRERGGRPGGPSLERAETGTREPRPRSAGAARKARSGPPRSALLPRTFSSRDLEEEPL